MCKIRAIGCGLSQVKRRTFVISQPTQVDDLRLVALPSAVGCADMFVRFALAEWSLRSLVDDATLVIRHIVKSSIAGGSPSRPRFLTVRLRLHGDCVVIEVDDDQPGEPPELAGWTISAVSLPGGGRNVWCELPLPDGTSAALPRRVAGRSAARQAGVPPVAPVPPLAPVPQQPPSTGFAEFLPEPALEATADSQILQRVLYGLNRSGNGQPG
jgi:hypothetical protein